ncbi:oxygen-independent coproporphyrinogen III oxidase [Thioalkalivibrio sp. HL-Eb18]|uniref:oxygen-independent coproporphyrinogen III oxidase n=1 Tax=Thioalkalivibrio sp. HL-Eb18 TaxID=1266913 RepID=UPI00035D4650|nr:oxygen-independent coproporphyrinogen III oxidase [Thioalkalivibrio sp. HL-Eb18]
MEQRLVFDPEVLRRYDVSGPRYTSYPTAPQFHEAFDAQAYARVARATNVEGAARPLSLYVHVPFCDTVCFYCACNKVITGNYRRATSYLDSLEQEIALQGEWFDRDRPVRQLHFGGGTPTYLSDEDLTRVMKALGRHFTLETGPEREFSIEIDPRAVRPGTLPLLASLGFNRISVGVQDVDPAVQKAVNRIQPFEVTEQVVRQAREHGFVSTNLDLIYGLPLQTVDTFSATLDRVLELRPERLAVYNYAHLPELFKTQRQIRDGDLPPASEKLAILEMTIQRLTDAGYVYIGMDHFALPDDELAIAQRAGTLQRNFQGYSTRAEYDLVALGPTAIGKIGDSYSQNLREVDAYQERLAAGQLPVFRGLELSEDDRLRRAVISELMCHSRIDFGGIEATFGIDFRETFADALNRLAEMEADGLVTIGRDGLEVQPRGRLLLRNIAMAFDAYLNREERRRYSKVV